MSTSPLVQIAFVLDCTASMTPWIVAAKTKMREIIDRSLAAHPDARFEVALVGYRDYGDLVRFRVVDFTTVNEVVDALTHLKATGGDDEAEDVAGALQRALDLNWQPEHSVPLLFHIADAPAHGFEYHSAAVSDRFAQGDPEGRDPQDILAHLAAIRVEYTFVRITSKTDRMLDVFRRVYSDARGVFRVIDLHPQSYCGEYGDARDGDTSRVFSPAVTRAVTESIDRYTSSQGM